MLRNVALALALLPGIAAAQSVRLEIHELPSSTPTDKQFLTGAKDVPQVVLGAELRIPSSDDRVPAVVLLHGSGGIGTNVDIWARELNGMGIATFIVDSFTGRKIVNTITDQSQLGALTMLVDAYRALDLLAHDSRIDPSRIAVMGFSRGGTPALYTSMRRFQKMWAPAGARFAAHLAFYPPCNRTYIEDTDLDDAPVRIFHGTADDYVPIGPCRAYVGRLRGAGRDVKLFEYANAGHAFDGPRKAPLKFPDAPTTRNCVLEEKPLGQIINSKSKRPFDYNDPCIEKGPTVAYNEDAQKQAMKDVREFLSAALKLK